MITRIEADYQSDAGSTKDITPAWAFSNRSSDRHNEANAQSGLVIWYRILIQLSWWRHQMESFSALLTLCAGNSPVPLNSPHKGQGRGALMFSLICAWINDWVNNREAAVVRRHCGHYDVTVMHSDGLIPTALSKSNVSYFSRTF